MKINQVVLSACLVGWGMVSCAKKSVGPENDSANTSQFVTEYAVQNYQALDRNFSLNSDGSIQYRLDVNYRCELVFNGRVERAVLANDSVYTVNYRYHSFTPQKQRCYSRGDRDCFRDMQQCDQVISRYDRLIGESKVATVDRLQRHRKLALKP